MPESSADELTLCPGKHPTVIFTEFLIPSNLPFLPIKIFYFSSPLSVGLCVTGVCVCLYVCISIHNHMYIDTHFLNGHWL